MQKCHKMVITFCYFEATIPMRRFLVAALSSVIWIAAALQSPRSQIFTDVTSAAGFRFRHEASHTLQKYLIETMGSGVACLDYDGDGNLDLFYVNGAALKDPMPQGTAPDKSDPRYWNRLYHNTGHGTFLDVTERSGVRGEGYGMGVAVGDYDNDGRPDLYVTGFGRNHLYHTRATGRFRMLPSEPAWVQPAGLPVQHSLITTVMESSTSSSPDISIGISARTSGAVRKRSRNGVIVTLTPFKPSPMWFITIMAME